MDQASSEPATMHDEPSTSHILPARSFSIAIDRPFEEAYEFAHRPENFSKWASGLSSSLHREGERWIAETPKGEATVRFTPPNDYGILDHWVTLPGQPEIYIPLRLISNGSGTEVVFTLFRQSTMDDVAFENDAGMVRKDLSVLKAVIEQRK